MISELEDKIAKADRVDLHYKPPYEYKYAVVRYCHRQGQPLKVAEYYIYGEELKSGNPLICWHWIDSTNFQIIEDGFYSEADAKRRLKELRRIRNETNS